MGDSVSRNRKRHFQRNFMLAMIAYVFVVLLAWPMARSTTSLSLKVLLALSPMVPLTIAIWFMARRIWHSDELEQRTHLLALGVATIVVSIFSMVGGFLATAKVFSLDTCAELLMWVFPVLMMSYGVAHWWVGRHYGLEHMCDDDESFPAYLRLLVAAAVLGLLAVWAYFKHIDSARLGLLCGMAAGIGAVGLVMAVNRWMRRNEPRG